MKPYQRQAGSILAFVLLALVTLGVLATLAFGTYYQIARGTQDTVLRAHASALLTQAAYVLATEARDSDVDSDGFAEPLIGTVVLDGGWEIPASSGAPKTDPWGTAIKYCPWDNGSTNSSAGRLAGDNPASPASLQFALVSAGPDKSFQTSCVEAKTGAQGDDGLRTISVSQMTQGVGGTYFYGDPVANVSALPATGSPSGMMRITKDTQLPYLWTGSAWVPMNSVAGITTSDGIDCSDFPPGALGRDTTDDLLICKGNGLPRVWKRVKD